MLANETFPSNTQSRLSRTDFGSKPLILASLWRQRWNPGG